MQESNTCVLHLVPPSLSKCYQIVVGGLIQTSIALIPTLVSDRYHQNEIDTCLLLNYSYAQANSTAFTICFAHYAPPLPLLFCFVVLVT